MCGGGRCLEYLQMRSSCEASSGDIYSVPWACQELWPLSSADRVPTLCRGGAPGVIAHVWKFQRGHRGSAEKLVVSWQA